MPNKLLMDEYGTRGIYYEKVAGQEASLAFRLAAMVAGGMLLRRMSNTMDEQERQDRLRLMMSSADPRIHAVSQELRYTRPPIVIPAMMPGSTEMSGPPVGMDAGMVRLASAASNIGKKTAGMLAKGLLAGGLVGGVLLADKAQQKALKYLSQEADPYDWSQARYGRPQLAYGVNEYGQTQMGTPFVARLGEGHGYSIWC